MNTHDAPRLIDLNSILTVDISGLCGRLPDHGRIALHAQVNDRVAIGLTHRPTAWRIDLMRDIPGAKPRELDPRGMTFTDPGVRVLRVTLDGNWSRDVTIVTFPYHVHEALGLEALPSNPGMRPTCLRILQRLVSQPEVSLAGLVDTLEDPELRERMTSGGAKFTGIYSSLIGDRGDSVHDHRGQNAFNNFIRNVRECAPAQPFAAVQGAA